MNVAGLTRIDSASVEVSEVQFSSNGLYEAFVSVSSTSDTLSRDTVVLFNGLPPGVSLENASGTTSTGVPYLNFRPAIASGGLGQNEQSAAVPVKIRNLENIPFSLQTTVMSGQPNRAPSLLPISDLTVIPGSKLSVKLRGQDQDGDSIRYAVQSTGPLPSMRLEGDELIISPSPSQIGTYEFNVIATDNALSVSQPVKLSVIADSNTNTRLSGKILNVTGAPISGLRVEVGNQQATTQSDGSFLLNFGTAAPTGDTLRVRAELLPGGKYPFIAEKLGLLLDHEIYAGFNIKSFAPFICQNSIAEPQSLPRQRKQYRSSLLPMKLPRQSEWLPEHYSLNRELPFQVH